VKEKNKKGRHPPGKNREEKNVENMEEEKKKSFWYSLANRGPWVIVHSPEYQPVTPRYEERKERV